MTIYHKTTWNCDHPNKQDFIALTNQGEEIIKPYIEAGYTPAVSNYWNPPWFDSNFPPSGQVTRFRIWNDLEQCQNFCNEMNTLRASDPLRASIQSELTAHDDTDNDSVFAAQP